MSVAQAPNHSILTTSEGAAPSKQTTGRKDEAIPPLAAKPKRTTSTVFRASEMLEPLVLVRRDADPPRP
jgi:hypothetical protein